MAEIEKAIQLNALLDDYIRLHDFLAEMQGPDKSLILRVCEDIPALGGIVGSDNPLEINSNHRLFEAIQTVITQEMYKKREELTEMAKCFHPDQDKKVIDKTKPWTCWKLTFKNKHRKGPRTITCNNCDYEMEFDWQNYAITAAPSVCPGCNTPVSYEDTCSQ